MINIDDLNTTSPCDDGIEFEYINQDGERPGIFFTIIGAQAEKVKAFIRKEINTERRQLAVKKDYVRTVEEDEDFDIRSAATRLAGWKGINQECTYDMAVKLCTINFHIRQFILEKSNDVSFFMKSKSSS